MRAIDAAKCWPLDGGGKGETSMLPPMDLPQRSRWWAHELAALRTPRIVGGEGGETGVGGSEGVEMGKSTKRKWSRGIDVARTKKRQRALQFSLSLKHKEGASVYHSPEHVFHNALFSRRKSCTVHTLRELTVRKKSQEAHDSLNKQCRRGMDHKERTKLSRSIHCPLNLGVEVVKHVVYPAKDDIFGDLLLLESSKVLFHSGADMLPTVIEDSFVTNQSGPDAISEIVPLRLMPASDITKQLSYPLEDLVKKERTHWKESTSIPFNDAARNHSSSAGFDGPQSHRNINIVKTCLDGMQQKCTAVPSLICYSGETPKSCSGNSAQDCLHMNTNCYQEIKEPSSNSVTSSAAVRTRTEAKNARYSAANVKKSTEISGRLAPTKHHISSEGNALSSAKSQGTVSAGINADYMSSCRSMPSQEYIPTSSPFGTFASFLCHESRKYADTRTSLSMEDQGSGYSKLHPVFTPASIGMAFMKLPGLERVEISSYNQRAGEDKFLNGPSVNTLRLQKQQLVTGMNNVMHGHNKICLSVPEAGEKCPDGYVRRGIFHPHQPTVRLMGKTVSVFKGSEEQELSIAGDEYSIIEEGSPSLISCQLPQKRLFPYQDSVIPIAHFTGSSHILPRIPSNSLSEARSTISDVQNQRLHRIHSASTVKDWNSGSQFVHQVEVNKACDIGTNSSTRHIGLYKPSQVIFPRNQHCHLTTHASSMYGEGHNFLGSAVQSSPFPPWMLNTSMQGKHQKSTFSSYNNPSNAPMHQPCQVPGAKLSSASFLPFDDHVTNNAGSRSSYQGAQPYLGTILASKFISAISPACIGGLENIDRRKDISFVDQRNMRPACANSVSQQPAKRQLITDKLKLTTPMVENMRLSSDARFW